MKFEEKPSEPTSPYAERRLERRQRSRDRLRTRQETTVESVETYTEVTTKETLVEITVNSSSGIKSTRIDDILKSVTHTGPPPPPPPPARTESRDIKEILATHRSRPRRPLNEQPSQNGVTSPKPTSPEPVKSPVARRKSEPVKSPVARKKSEPVTSPKVRKKEERPRKKEEAPPKVEAQPAPTVRAQPAPKSPHNILGNLDDDEGDNILEKLRKRKERLLNNKPGCCSHERCKPDGDNPDQGPRLHTWPCLLSRYNNPETPPPPPKVEADAPPKTPDDLERQTLDSLEGMTSVIIKERDQARKERNNAREKCASILNEYDGRRQAWQNQLNVVKIRLEHYARRHDKMRNDITKQQEQFDIERSRMKERHATQIEGLFGDLFSKIRADDRYVGTSTGIDEVNYKLQAFMELWKGLAHDVDDLYDKEHYCLRLCETVKSLQEQIKYQNTIISGLAKGVPSSRKDSLPPPNINVTVDHHKWEILPPHRQPPLDTKDQNLPEFEEFRLLDRLLPEEDGLSLEDILQQFAPIEETLNSFPFKSLDRPNKREVATSPPPLNTNPPISVKVRDVPLSFNRPKRREFATSPPPLNDNPPISVQVIDVPCKKAAPHSFLPKPSININKSIDDFNKQPDLPIKLDPKEIANSPRNAKYKDAETPAVEIHTDPVVKALKPFSSPPMFDEPTKQLPLETTLDDPALALLKETTIDGPAPKKKRKKKKSKPAPEPVVEPVVEPAEPEPVVEVEEAKPVHALRPTTPSPTPSFRRRRASMESAKDFSILGDPDFEYPSSPPPLPKTPKETTLDDPAITSPSSSVASPAPSANDPKKRKWKPSMPIFNKKLPKSQPPAEPVEPVDPVQDRAPSTSNSESKRAPSDPVPEDSPAPAAPRHQKRAKSLPRLRDPSLPRNMASANLKRALSNPRLKKNPGSESFESDSDSDIRSLIESVYMPLHLTPASRSGSKKNVADDAKSDASSFARRNKMPGSMGWLDSNKPNTSDESSDDEDGSTSESDDDSQSSSEEDGEQSSESDAEKSSIGDEEEEQEEDDEEVDGVLDNGMLDNRNSMLSSIMKDFDDDSKDWMSNSFASSQPEHRGEILI